MSATPLKGLRVLEFTHTVMGPTAGLILADGYGAAVVREAPEHRLAGATRRSMLLRFARTAASRLQTLADPTAPAGAEF